jgi:hypothetical protein
MQKTILFKNETSYILVSDTTILVKDSTSNWYSPLAVMVYNSVYVEFNRPMTDFKEAISKTRLPLLVKDMQLPVSNMRLYQLVRMQTGNVDDKVIVEITEKDNKITGITFNKKLKNDPKYRKYNSLPAGNQISIPVIESGNDKIMGLKFQSQLTYIVKALFKCEVDFVRANYMTNNVDVVVNAEGVEIKISLLLNKKAGVFELDTISLI